MPRLGLIVSEQNEAYSWEIFQHKNKTVSILFYSTDSLVATFSLLDSGEILKLMAHLVRCAADNIKYSVVTRPLHLQTTSQIYLTNRKTNPNIEIEFYSASMHHKTKIQFTKEQIISAVLLLWKALASLGGIV